MIGLQKNKENGENNEERNKTREEKCFRVQEARYVVVR